MRVPFVVVNANFLLFLCVQIDVVHEGLISLRYDERVVFGTESDSVARGFEVKARFLLHRAIGVEGEQRDGVVVTRRGYQSQRVARTELQNGLRVEFVLALLGQ